MKKAVTLLFITASFCAGAQHPCSLNKTKNLAGTLTQSAARSIPTSLISHEHKYDMKFVHLDLEVEDTTKYIRGSSSMIAEVVAASLDTFVVILDQNLVIDSIWFNGSKHVFIRHDSMVKVVPQAPPAKYSTFSSQIWYEGMPPAGGSALGDGFTSTTDWSYGQKVTWSLSQPFVAYHWWPAKQVLSDKIDSSWVFVTTDSSNMAGSNGELENVSVAGSKKRYEWKSRSPIDYYLISVAVAKYKEYNVYAKPLYLNDSILVQNFIYTNAFTDNFWVNYEKPKINEVTAMIELYSRLYGMYPFYKEKYGHCMAAVGGGMEHQTMSTMGTLAYTFLNAHELAHQWWGDNVTCRSWSDIFMNEGFASYSELVALEHLSPASQFASNLNGKHNSVMILPGGSIHFTGADTMNISRIFDGRLTYDKGGAILHTLRFLTNNDSLWYNTLRDFQYAFKGKSASVKDFANFYHTSTNIDPTDFFNQWYYGEGYPTFTAKYNYDGSNLYLEVAQTTSMPSKTPLFITPVEYRIFRQGKPDTTVRLMHAQPKESYTLAIAGKINTVLLDDKNWIINKHVAVTRDVTIGVPSITASGSVKVTPNPSGGEFLLGNADGRAGVVTVHDVAGRKIFERSLSTTKTIDLSAFPDGIYFLTIISGGAAESHKLVKQ